MSIVRYGDIRPGDLIVWPSGGMFLIEVDHLYETKEVVLVYSDLGKTRNMRIMRTYPYNADICMYNVILCRDGARIHDK